MPIHRLINAALRPCAWVLALSLAVVWSSAALADGRDCEAEPTDMFIDYADLINCALDLIGDIDVFRFTGGSGEAVRVQISGSAFFNSACFELFDPDGMPLGERTCGNRSADYRLERTGSHAILVS
jgi:hypothetical protein